MIWNYSVKYTRARGKFGEWVSRWPLSGARDSYLYWPTELRARANAWPSTDLAPKRLNKSTRTTQPKSSKAPSDTERKLLKFVMVMIGKWFDHHFSLFFQGLALTHKKLALTLAVDQRTWRNFLQIFKRKSYINASHPENLKLKG